MSEGPITGSEIQRLQTLLETVRLLNSTLELKELTGIILEVVRAEVSVERISVFVVDRARNMIRSLVAQDVEGEEILLPMGVGIAGTVASTGEVLDIVDVYADKRFDRRFDGKFGYYTNDLLALPVCNRRGDIVGVIELLNRLRPITPADREFLLGISVYIGLALENAWLHAQVVAKERLERVVVQPADDPAGTGRAPDASQNAVAGIDNPYAFVMGYLELARDRGDLPEPMRTYLEQVFAGINQTVTAARSFQELTETRQELVPIYLNDQLRQLSEARAQEWDRQNIKTTLVVEIVPPVFADEDEMSLVLSYLIRNAENSVLQTAAKRELRLHLWCADQSVHISIHSNAPAVRPVVKPRLLEPFWPSPEDSPTILGLAVANSILQRYQGQIRMESGRGTGTTFLVVVPTLKESPRKPD